MNAFTVDEARLQELVIDMVSSYLCDAHVKLLREAVAVAGGGGGAVPNKEGAAESGGGKSKENASPQRGVAVGIKSSAFVQPNRIATNSNKQALLPDSYPPPNQFGRSSLAALV